MIKRHNFIDLFIASKNLRSTLPIEISLIDAIMIF